MLKKFICAAMAASLAAVTLAGCGNPDAGDKSAADGKTFTYWCPMGASNASRYKTNAEMLMYQEMEKRSGVKIEFTHPPVGQEQEQFNLLIASREYPDMVEYYWNTYPGGPEKAIEDNVIIKLNDLMEHTPNFAKLVTHGGDYERQAKTDSGSYFAFPSINTGDARVFSGLILRKDWLDELGLAVPETVADWETVLRAFKEKKGAAAPFSGNNLTFVTGTNQNTFNVAFGVGTGLYVDGGKVKFGPLEEGYKQWLTLMNKWYQEGLIDKDYATNNDALLNAKMTDGTAGARFGYIGSTIGSYLSMMRETEPEFDLVAAQHPVLNKGEEPYFAEAQYEVQHPHLAIMSSCKNPVEACKWADYWYGEEGTLLKNFGVEGDTYNMVDGKPVYTDKVLKDPEGLSVSEAMAKYFRANNPGPGINQVEDYLEQYYQFDQQKDAFKTWGKYIGNIQSKLLPQLTPGIDESEEMATLRTEIFTYSDEMILKFIQGTEPMENYGKFVEKLNKIGVQRYLEINQAMYDRYLAR